MVNILLEGYRIEEPWLFEELKHYILPEHRVAVIAFSFRESRVKNAADWQALYGKGCGRFYDGIVGGLMAYGIKEENIAFVHYFCDTKEEALQKVKSADILYFLGGLPDKMTERICEFDLLDAVKAHSGIAMGYSAGAVIQLAEYHLSPDDDYPEFAYYKGLSYLDSFYLEVHYEDREVQNEAIRTVLAERGKPVYATEMGKSAILVDNGEIKLLGNVKTFIGKESNQT